VLDLELRALIQGSRRRVLEVIIGKMVVGLGRERIEGVLALCVDITGFKTFIIFTMRVHLHVHFIHLL